MMVLRLDVAVVRLDGVDDDGALLVLLCKLHAQLDMAAFHLVVDGLAEVVQQTCALGQRHVHAQLARRACPAMWATSMEWFRTF